jgi:hypothetical protein
VEHVLVRALRLVAQALQLHALHRDGVVEVGAAVARSSRLCRRRSELRRRRLKLRELRRQRRRRLLLGGDVVAKRWMQASAAEKSTPRKHRDR